MIKKNAGTTFTLKDEMAFFSKDENLGIVTLHCTFFLIYLCTYYIHCLAPSCKTRNQLILCASPAYTSLCCGEWRSESLQDLVIFLTFSESSTTA